MSASCCHEELWSGDFMQVLSLSTTTSTWMASLILSHGTDCSVLSPSCTQCCSAVADWTFSIHRQQCDSSVSSRWSSFMPHRHCCCSRWPLRHWWLVCSAAGLSLLWLALRGICVLCVRCWCWQCLLVKSTRPTSQHDTVWLRCTSDTTVYLLNKFITQFFHFTNAETFQIR